jgi:hypothetical protein
MLNVELSTTLLSDELLHITEEENCTKQNQKRLEKINNVQYVEVETYKMSSLNTISLTEHHIFTVDSSAWYNWQNKQHR